MPFDLPERLSNKIIPEPMSGCWLWIGALDGKGYGQAKISGTRKQAQVHRTVYELLRRKIPATLVLDHRCRVRCCCNPDHLEPKTNRANILCGTGVSARNAIKTHCDSGHSLVDAYIVGNARKCRPCQLSNMAAYYRRNKK